MSDEQLYDEGAENSLLGACIINDNAFPLVMDEIEPEDFYLLSNAHVWKAMDKMSSEGISIDSITLCGELAREGILEEVGGKATIWFLADSCPAAGNVRQYARIVRDYSVRRTLQTAGRRIEALAEEHDGDTDSLIDKSEAILYGARKHDTTDTSVEVKDLGEHALARITDARAGKRTAGHSTEFTSLDSIIGGLAPGNLSILAARPSQGKTALAVNIAKNIAASQPVALYSLEMTRDEIHERMYCAEARVGITGLHLGHVSDEDYIELVAALGRMESLQLHIDDSSGMNLASFRSRVRRYCAHTHPVLIIVDYIQLMTGDGSESRNYELANITRGMKQVAREYNTHVMALSQLRRPEEGRDREPRLLDLRDSGALEQDADLVIGLWRPEPRRDDENLTPSNRTGVYVLKHRTGPTGHLEMDFTPDYCQFREVVR